jgi:hypothetical protein
VKDDSGDDEIYDLVRGAKTSMVIRRLDDDGEEKFVPKQRVVMMISSEESDDEYSPKKPSDKSDSENDLDQSKFEKNENKIHLVENFPEVLQIIYWTNQITPK